MKRTGLLILLLCVAVLGLAAYGRAVRAASAPAEKPDFAFTTQDLDGNVVTEKIFSEKALTVVNIWGTFCGPCIREMPDLAQWAESMDERVQLIGLVIDIESPEDTGHLEAARQIMESAGGSFVNLIPNGDFSGLLSGVSAVPTTIFVDSSGKLVGSPVVGAYIDGYKAAVEEYLKQLDEG